MARYTCRWALEVKTYMFFSLFQHHFSRNSFSCGVCIQSARRTASSAPNSTHANCRTRTAPCFPFITFVSACATDATRAMSRLHSVCRDAQGVWRSCRCVLFNRSWQDVVGVAWWNRLHRVGCRCEARAC